jgi:hypothetical protein
MNEKQINKDLIPESVGNLSQPPLILFLILNLSHPLIP